jgi:hypothetical protein
MMFTLQRDAECQGTIPPARRQHTSAFFQNVIYIHGGLSVRSNMVLSDLSILNPSRYQSGLVDCFS